MRLKIVSTYEKWDKYRDILSDYQYTEIKLNENTINRYITINSIEDIINISKLTNHEIIISSVDNEDTYVEIYDGYRE